MDRKREMILEYKTEIRNSKEIIPYQNNNLNKIDKKIDYLCDNRNKLGTIFFELNQELCYFIEKTNIKKAYLYS